MKLYQIGCVDVGRTLVLRNTIGVIGCDQIV
jgi:hypothetical protein